MATAELQERIDASGLTWDDVRHRINQLAISEGHYSGYPFPSSSARLVLEPGTPHTKLQGMKFDPDEPTEDAPDIVMVNRWYSYRLKCYVWVVRENGRPIAFKQQTAEVQKLGFWLRSAVVAYEALNVEAELQAQATLKEYLSESQWRSYILAGAFVETSKRSGVMYLFRKLRPTVAMVADDAGEMRTLAILCLHPIGYYENTWCGTLAPSDDVLAHILMMRGDERKYWAKAEHHRPYEMEAGM